MLTGLALMVEVVPLLNSQGMEGLERRVQDNGVVEMDEGPPECVGSALAKIRCLGAVL
jgi:hypothetical protein